MRATASRDCNPIIFKQAHELADLKMSNAQISKVLGFSDASISRWLDYPDWNGYMGYKETLRNEYKERYNKARQVEAKEPTVALPVKPLSNETEKTLIGVLTELVNEVHLLREAWEKSPTKLDVVRPEDVKPRGLFGR